MKVKILELGYLIHGIALEMDSKLEMSNYLIMKYYIQVEIYVVIAQQESFHLINGLDQ